MALAAVVFIRQSDNRMQHVVTLHRVRFIKAQVLALQSRIQVGRMVSFVYKFVKR